jgi:hypothetical protein
LGFAVIASISNVFEGIWRLSLRLALNASLRGLRKPWCFMASTTEPARADNASPAVSIVSGYIASRTFS